MAICALLGGVVILKKRSRRPMTARVARKNVATNGHVAAYKNGSTASATNGHTNGHANGHSTNGHKPAADGIYATLNRAKRMRKRGFSYRQFYTNVVMELSSSGTTGWTPVYRKFAAVSATNGAVQNGAVATQPSKVEMDLVEYHNRVIEEQKSVLLQQSALIEQKSRLISEQNSILKKQFEMIDKQYSMNFE
jgi:hypothetical protein